MQYHKTNAEIHLRFTLCCTDCSICTCNTQYSPALTESPGVTMGAVRSLRLCVRTAMTTPRKKHKMTSNQLETN